MLKQQWKRTSLNMNKLETDQETDFQLPSQVPEFDGQHNFHDKG